jgi:hypothetical protein
MKHYNFLPAIVNDSSDSRVISSGGRRKNQLQGGNQLISTLHSTEKKRNFIIIFLC